MSEYDFHEVTYERFLDRIYLAFEATSGAGIVGQRESANVRKLQAYFKLLASGDDSPFLNALTEDSILKVAGPAEFAMSGEWHGPKAIGQAMRRNYSLLSAQAAKIEHVVAQGEKVILVASETGTVRDTGKTYSCQWMQLFEFRSGKLGYILVLADTASMQVAF